MAAPCSARNALLIAGWSALPSFRDDRPDALPRHHAPDVPRYLLEDVDRRSVVHAERQRGRVHELEPLLDRVEVRQFREELRVRIRIGIAVVYALDSVLAQENRLGADLERT